MASAQMQQLVKIMKTMMEQRGMPMFGEDIDPVILRATIEAAQKGMPLEPGVEFIAGKLGGVDAELCMPENVRKDALILYVHGGGLICGNAFTSRGYGSMLAGETSIPVYTFSYRLAPENPFPAAVDDCFNAYKDALERYPNIPIFLIGESGGGYLSITTALKAKAAGLRMPAGVIPYSPPIDLSGTIDRSKNEGTDITLTNAGMRSLQKMYCPNEALLKDPLVSPIFGDYKGFSPMLLAWDSGETLAADSEKLVELAKVAGVEVHYKGYDGCFHAFATTGRGTPESAEVLADTVAFINAHI